MSQLAWKKRIFAAETLVEKIEPVSWQRNEFQHWEYSILKAICHSGTIKIPTWGTKLVFLEPSSPPNAESFRPRLWRESLSQLLWKIMSCNIGKKSELSIVVWFFGTIKISNQRTKQITWTQTKYEEIKVV